jgi:hypothetical protein
MESSGHGYLSMCIVEARKSTKESVRTAGVLVGIRIVHLPNTNQKPYWLSQTFGACVLTYLFLSLHLKCLGFPDAFLSFKMFRIKWCLHKINIKLSLCLIN